MLQSGRVRLGDLVTHRFPIEQGVEAFRVAESKDSGAIKG